MPKARQHHSSSHAHKHKRERAQSDKLDMSVMVVRRNACKWDELRKCELRHRAEQ